MIMKEYLYIVRYRKIHFRIAGFPIISDTIMTKVFKTPNTLKKFITSNRKRRKYLILSVNRIRKDTLKKMKQLKYVSGDSDFYSGAWGLGTGMDEATMYAMGETIK